MSPRELAPGLWRWTATHPDWEPCAPSDSPGDWEREVGSLLCLLADATVFIDALAPTDHPGFWEWADSRAAERQRVLVLTTVGFHRRSRDQLVERYGAATSRARSRLPDGIEPIPLRGAGEVMFWIEAHGALVCGDRVLGGADGGLRLCPPSWLAHLDSGLDRDRLRALLRPLLELPIERVLVAHGEPVLAGGLEALAEAIG